MTWLQRILIGWGVLIGAVLALALIYGVASRLGMAIGGAINRFRDRKAPRRLRWCEVCGIELEHGWALLDTFDRAVEGDQYRQAGDETRVAAYFCDDHRPRSAVPWRP